MNERTGADCMISKPAKYTWDEDRGVVKDDRQMLQLLLAPASREFRTRCGKLLVAALNAEKKRKAKA